MTGLTVHRFSARYPAQPDWAVHDIDLQIVSGQVTWLTGALGSGTSTLLLALAGLIPRLTGGDSTGHVMAGTIDVSTRSPLAQGIGYLGPSPMLQISGITSSVRDEIAVGPMNLGVARDQIDRRVDTAMMLFEIGHLASRAPGALSGGETQRMLLAALHAAEPAIWLLDEPFSALDHASTLRVRRLIRDLATGGCTVVVTWDDADTMLGVADRLIVLEGGQVALDGDPAPLLAGDAMTQTGAGSTDAATLANLAGFAAPRAITRTELEEQLVPRKRAPAHPAATRHESTTRVLRVEAVRFAYDTHPVLDDLSFSIGNGEAVGLFGANGAGKSTLLRLAMALEHPAEGSVETLGTSTAGRFPEDLAPRAGFLFQQPERQLFAASVAAECALAPQLAGWDARRIAASVADVLNQLGLSDTASEHPYDLPLPRRRLVALAAVLTADPDLVLLDEPTAGLDVTSRDRVIRVVQERVSRGAAVLAITHDPFFFHEALDRGLILERGRIVHDGPIRDVIDDHRLIRPAALALAIRLGLAPGRDRRKEVVEALRQH